MLQFSDDSGREIFRTKVGGADVRVDPIAFWRKLHDAMDGSEIGPVMKQAESKVTKARLDAVGRLAAWSREAFGFDPIGPEGGVTEGEAVAALYAFFSWEDDLKKTRERTPSGAGPTGPSPASSDTSGGTASG